MTRPPTLVLAVVVGTGVVAVSTGALFTRAAYQSVGVGTLGAGLVLAVVRMGVTSAITSGSWSHRLRADRSRTHGPLPSGTRRRTVIGGLLLGVHFATWLPSLAFTSIAASVTLVTTVPIWVALAMWLQGERPSAATGAGIALAVTGGALVAFGDVGGDAGSNPLLGDALALVAAVTFAAHLLLSREVQRRGLGLWQWTSAVTAVGALTVAPLALVLAPSDGPYPAGFWLAAVGLALVPQLVGHSSFSWAVRWLSPALVSVAILLEPLLSTLGGMVLFDEVPGVLAAVGGLVLVSGVALTTVAESGRAPTVADEPVVST